VSRPTISKRGLRRAVARTRTTWQWDADGWLVRPWRHGQHRPDYAFAESCHAFVELGHLHCRNRRQAGILDLGGIV